MSIAIIDYGVGNLLNVARAFKACGREAHFISEAKDLYKYDKAVLPGVGAFRDGMLNLQLRGFDEAIRSYIETEKPFLGICLGMQLLMESSEEFGLTEGLGFFKGSVNKIPNLSHDKQIIKVPHIGWSPLRCSNPDLWNRGIYKNVDPGAFVYFVHSFRVQPANASDLVAFTEYQGLNIPASLQKNNVFTAQFHPERSADAGLKIIQNFSDLK